MKKSDPEWYKNLISEERELIAEEEAIKMNLKIQIGKRLLQDKDKLDEKTLRKLAREMKELLIDLDVRVKDMPSQLRAWMKLAEQIKNEGN